jgi:hypothetical protein
MMNFKAIGLTAVAVIAAGCFAPQAQADEINDAMARETFARTGDIFANRSIDRQATLLLGLSFPEHEGFNDAMAIHDVYKAGLKKRATTPIVTEDLPNPYTTSVLTELRGR